MKDIMINNKKKCPYVKKAINLQVAEKMSILKNNSLSNNKNPCGNLIRGYGSQALSTRLCSKLHITVDKIVLKNECHFDQSQPCFDVLFHLKYKHLLNHYIMIKILTSASSFFLWQFFSSFGLFLRLQEEIYLY